MRFSFTAKTDIGNVKETNQDSLLVKYGMTSKAEVLMAIVCDGMGGLSKGEVASATVIKRFEQWFTEELPYELEHLDLQVIGYKWSLLLKELNMRISDYSKKLSVTMGTTFTGILFVNDDYILVHVGDSRAYHIGQQAQQLTKDQTYIARELERGTITPEQAKIDKRRNMLLQCVGASETLEPDIMFGKNEKGMYLLCSDGFRHEITLNEIRETLSFENNSSTVDMDGNVLKLIELNKARQERDNISAILIKVG